MGASRGMTESQLVARNHLPRIADFCTPTALSAFSAVHSPPPVSSSQITHPLAPFKLGTSACRPFEPRTLVYRSRLKNRSNLGPQGSFRSLSTGGSPSIVVK